MKEQSVSQSVSVNWRNYLRRQETSSFPVEIPLLSSPLNLLFRCPVTAISDKFHSKPPIWSDRVGYQSDTERGHSGNTTDYIHSKSHRIGLRWSPYPPISTPVISISSSRVSLHARLTGCRKASEMSLIHRRLPPGRSIALVGFTFKLQDQISISIHRSADGLLLPETELLPRFIWSPFGARSLLSPLPRNVRLTLTWSCVGGWSCSAFDNYYYGHPFDAPTQR